MMIAECNKYINEQNQKAAYIRASQTQHLRVQTDANFIWRFKLYADYEAAKPYGESLVTLLVIETLQYSQRTEMTGNSINS
jgi:hypothetical protein